MRRLLIVFVLVYHLCVSYCVKQSTVLQPRARKSFRTIYTSPFAAYDEYSGEYYQNHHSYMYEDVRRMLVDSGSEYGKYYSQYFPINDPFPVPLPSFPTIIHDNSSNIPANEMAALKDLFESTNGNEWAWVQFEPLSTHWNFTGSHNPCTERWQGLGCICSPSFSTSTDSNNTCRIGSIWLMSYSLQGTIPASISNFTELYYLEFANNMLYSTIPNDLYQLSNLQILDLSYNNISGSLSANVGNLTSLTHLILTSTDLNGTIPETLAHCSQLQEIALSVTYLSGTLPSTLGSLQNLSVLNIYAADITGTLPASYGNLTSLKLLNLFQNSLTSSIPPSFGNLSSLWEMNLFENQLNGSLPLSFSELTHLYTINLFGNELTGPLPVGMFTPTSRLLVINLFDNLFTGEIPSEVGQMPLLLRLDFCTNQLSSTLPASLGNLTYLVELYLNNNRNLHSTIPISYTEMYSLFVFYIQSNVLTGSISLGFGRLLNMTDFDLSANLLTGPLPVDFGDLSRLSELALYGNLLSSSIPDALTRCSKMNILYLSNNLFTGTLPELIGRWSGMVDLYINNNRLTGTVPKGLKNMTVLEIFLADSNSLRGNINDFINSTSLKSLTTFGMSDNQLTGTLSHDLFLIPTLTTVALVSNCITGSIPADAICRSDSQLQMLALDGITSASTCELQIFPNIPYIKAYGLSGHLKTGIPECLFQLPLLQTLHLSGNALTGSLSDVTDISNSLMDLSLSHNLLTGTIPDSIQLKEWTNLDLSYNRLTGVLNEKFHPLSPSSALSLQDNRLSGVIPSSLHSALNISILLSNLFSCDYTRSQLPDHDTTSDIYQCGSDSFNRAILFYASVLTILLMVRLAVWFSFQQEKENDKRGFTAKAIASVNKKSCLDRRRLFRWILQMIRKLHLWMSIYEEYDRESDKKRGMDESGGNRESNNSRHRPSAESVTSNSVITKMDLDLKPDSKILLFGHIAHALRSASMIILAVILFLFLPVYLVLTVFYKTYTYEYAFTTSAAFLSGVAPTVVLFVLYSLFMVLLFNVFDKTLYYGILRTDKHGHIVRQTHSQSVGSVSEMLRGLPSTEGVTDLRTNSDDVIKPGPTVLNPMVGDTTDSSQSSESKINRKPPRPPAKIHYTLCFCVLVVNIVVVFLVNIGFVYISINYGATDVILAQISVAVFKLTWSDIALRGMIRVGSNYVNGRQLTAAPSKTTQQMRSSVFFDIFRLTSAVPSAAPVVTAAADSSAAPKATKEAANRNTTTLRSLWFRPTVSSSATTVVAKTGSSGDNGEETTSVASNPVELPRPISVDSNFGRTYSSSSYNEGPDSLNSNSHHSIIQHIYEQEYESRYILFQIVLSLINNIAIPFLATTAISSNCFYNIFVPPPQVEASYSISQCVLYYLQLDGDVRCVLQDNLTHKLSFTPPFIYSYQCSNSFVTSYGAMYVYMYVVVLFINPLVSMTIVELRKYSKEGTRWNRLLASLLPPILKPLPDTFPTVIPLLFDRDGFIVRTARNIAILSTLGLIFPPLAVVICSSMISYTYYEQIKISRFLMAVYTKCRGVVEGSSSSAASMEDPWEYFEKYKKILETQCNNTLAPLNSLFWLIIPFAVLFYSYYLFDMLGDAVGFNAIYITLGVAAMPVLIYVSFTTYRMYNPIGSTRETGSGSWIERMYAWYEAKQRQEQLKKQAFTPENSMEMTPSMDRPSRAMKF